MTTKGTTTEGTTGTRTHTTIGSPIGRLTLVATDGKLSGVYMDGQRRAPGPATLGDASVAGAEEVFAEAIRQLGEYFAGERTEFDLPLHLEGSDFQLGVWRALTRIPYGQTRTYGEIAAEFGGGWETARAVGAINGQNPLAIVVPCHRVIGADGSLTGYGGGLERKRFLLDLESREARLFP